MTLSSGSHLGPYEILSAIGAGGMGEVYKARDTRLDRTVALKVLPPHLATDQQFRERFDREARAISALEHPHICALYDVGEQDGTSFLVMQYLEGGTLADALAKGHLPLDQALRYAIEIADALDRAHRHGITHRDLKPGNIMLTKSGAKLLDFGLAKHGAGGEAGWAGGAGDAPTMAAPITAQGTIIGTVQYMAPEQLEGRAADPRTDIFAFGAVVYEMVTGKKAFEGKSQASLIGAILKSEPPPMLQVQALTPPLLDHVVRRCLAKEPDERWQTASDVMRELTWVAQARSEPGRSMAGMSAVSRRSRYVPWALAAMASAAAITLGVTAFRRAPNTSSPGPARRWTIAPPSGVAALAVQGNTRDLAIAPDGTLVVYRGNDGTQLFVRALDQLEATALSGPGAPQAVFFSPDGQWVGFFDSDTLKKVAITGGPAVMVCRIDTANGASGATWGADGTIIFATNTPGTGLWRVSAAGGEQAVLTTPNRERGELSHRLPEFLPGGDAVLFTIVPVSGGVDAAQIAVLDLRTGTQKILVRGGSHGHYVRSGHLVYGVAGTLRAVAFDLDRLDVEGTPVPVLPSVLTTPVGAADFDVARDGTLVYTPTSADALQPPRTLVWVDRQGREEAIRAPVRTYLYPRISPDGRRVALDIRDQALDIWTWDLARERLTRVTFDPGPDQFAIWTPDGGRLVFSSFREGGIPNLFSQSADGTGTSERLTQGLNTQLPNSISPDGTRLLFRENAASTGTDLMVLALDGDRRAQPLVQTPLNEQNGEISPNGDWVAYQSDESGQNEVYVRPFPNAGAGRWQISTGGGTRPLWARTGQELFYVAPSGSLMSVGIERGANFVAANPARLFEGRYFMGVAGANAPGAAGGAGRQYDVSPDGRRFLMIKPVAATEQTVAPPGIVVVQNWFEELKRLVPGK